MTEKMTTVLIHLPQNLKERLDSKRREGYSLSGYVRSLLERDLNPSGVKGKKGRVKDGTTSQERSRVTGT